MGTTDQTYGSDTCSFRDFASSQGSGGGENSRKGRTKSYDTIGTLPCIGAQTAAATPGDMEAYVARSTAEVCM